MGHKLNRSAISGRFVKKSTVKKSPKTTVTETTKRHKKGR
jgi:hypothetical protein